MLESAPISASCSSLGGRRVVIDGRMALVDGGPRDVCINLAWNPVLSGHEQLSATISRCNAKKMKQREELKNISDWLCPAEH